MFRKMLRRSTAICLSVAAVAAASAAVSADVMDFEDGTFDENLVHMKTDDGGDFSVISVADFNGSKQLKIDVQDCSLLPKVQFEVDKIVGVDNLSKINKIEMDVTFASKDGVTPPNWIGGALGTAGGDNSPGWDQTDYDGGEYENPVSETIKVERKFLLPSKKFVDGTEGSIALLMRWASEVPYDMYVDNVRFLDKDGNELPLMLSGGAAAAPAEEAPAAAEETAPASDAQTTSTPTGNFSAAGLAGIMSMGMAFAISSQRKKK